MDSMKFLIVLNLIQMSLSLTCLKPGICINGITLYNYHTNDYNDCAQNCHEDSNCQWFTFDPESDKCHLYETCPTISASNCPKCISSETKCPGEKECNTSGQCVGTVIGSTDEEDKDSCIKACKRILGCEWFTYNLQDQICTLMKDCNSLNEKCQHCLSGLQYCYGNYIMMSLTTLN